MATTIQTIEVPKKARALDTSGNNNHGQIYSGRGLEFDGVSDHLLTGYGDGLNPYTTPITVAIWVKTAAADGKIFIGPTAGTNQRFYIGHTGGVWDMGIQDSIWNSTTNEVSGFSDQPSYEVDTWYRIVIVMSAGQATMYVNGVKSYAKTYTSYVFDSDITIGSFGDNTSYYWDGMLSDAQIWDAAFTQADITYDYLNPESLALNGSGTALTESNLKLWYPMQDGHRGQQSYILDGANSGAVVEEVTNGDFSDGATGWATSGEAAIIDSATLVVSSGGLQYISNTGLDLVNTKTYKITFTATRTVGTGNLEFGYNSGLSVSGSPEIDTSGVQTIYFKPIYNSTNFGFKSKTASGNYTWIIDNISVKTVNDKNNATTVFYGDMTDLCTDNDANFGKLYNTANTEFDFTKESTAFAGGDGYDVLANSAFSVDNISALIETDNSATGLKLANTASAKGGTRSGALTTVVGRTYELDVTHYATSESYVDVDIYILVGTDAGGAQLVNATNSDGTYSVTFVATTTSIHLTFGPNNTVSGNSVRIKTIQLREVGLASGWTDADQQLHIPQTALQSYNELAWFDGTIASNGYVDLDSGITTSGNSWSLSFWVFHDDNGQAFDIVFGDGTSQYIALSKDSVDKLMYRDSSPAYHAISDAAIPESEWVHITITAIADTSITAYVNGVAQTTNSNMTNTTLLLERFMRGYSSALYHTLGTINEISYYNDVLTSAEVLDLFNDGKAKSALEADGSAGLVGYWRNNGLSEWKDLKGSNDGNTTAGVVETILIPQGVDSTRDNQGFLMNRQKDTSCFNNTASGGYIEIPVAAVDDDLAFLGVGDGFSIQAWIKMNGDNNTDNTMIVSRNNNTDGYRLEYNTAGKISFGIEENGTLKTAVTDSAISIGTWYHVVGTFDGDPGNDGSGEIKLYLNGDTDGSVTNNNTTSNDMDTSMSPMRIGKHYWANPQIFDGQIDGVLIYNKVLSLEEVERNYNATKGSHRN